MENEKVTGTTLEVLAPYLPYGIEVESLQWRGSRCTLIGLQRGAQLSVKGAGGVWPEEVLPVLYSFEDLCTPLADGTVPAVEFAKLCLGDDVGWIKGYAHYEPSDGDEEEGPESHSSEETVEVGVQDEWEPDNRISFTIYPDWTWYGYGRSDNRAPAAAIDYLRSKHFAVGLEPHQYIRKTHEQG